MRYSLISVVCLSSLLMACDPGAEPSRGFRLPDGDAARGEEAFAALRCHACHDVEGLELEPLGVGEALVTLGGQTERVRTYEELVTSIINPSHRLADGYELEDIASAGESLMVFAYLNEVMTVQQLVDLVEFLQDSYEVEPPELDPYGYLYFP